MEIVGGSIIEDKNNIMPTPAIYSGDIGDTVLVRVTPESPEFYLGPEDNSIADAYQPDGPVAAPDPGSPRARLDNRRL